MAWLGFFRRDVHRGAAAHAAYAVALAESLLSDAPLMGRAAVQAYSRAKAYAADDDEGKMIEIVSRSKGAI